MLAQVAELFLFRNWFVVSHLLETSRQLVVLESELVLLFFLFFASGKSKHHKIASILSCGMVSVLAIAVYMAVVCIPAVAIFLKFYF